MNEHGQVTLAEGGRGSTPVGGTPRKSPGAGKSDLVVDLTGVEELDFTSLGLLLTAQQNAMHEDRAIWLLGVPLSLWHMLHAMKLSRFFKAFPVSEGTAA
jgi:anti-anti-sigma regulatory factor